MPYKRNGKWLAQVRLNGQTKRKTFPTRKEAIQWEVRLKRKISRSMKKETPSILLIDWATDYLRYSQSKFVKKTWKEKQAMFKSFFQTVPAAMATDQLTPGHVLSHLQIVNDTRSGYAANKDRKNLVAAWNWGIKYMGIPSPNPCLVDRFPEERQKRYIPPEAHYWKVYNVAESDQDQVMLLAYLHLAARRSELFNLRWEDVDFSDSRLRLYTRKRQDGSLEYDWLPMTEDLYNVLLDHRQISQTDWVFPNPANDLPYDSRSKWMNRLCDNAGVKRFGLHSIRHMTASILAKENVSLVDIQAVLRHRKISTTERYIKRLTSLRPALKLLPGLKNKKPPQEPPNAKKGPAISG